MPTYGIISDTHGLFHPDIPRHFEGVEAILHGGDVVDLEILKTLGEIAPTYAVAGNCDYDSPELPPSRVAELPFGKAGIAHGHFFSSNKDKRSYQPIEFFAEHHVPLIVTGHSHAQLLDFQKNVFLCNPGAACKPRFNLQSSLCVLTWDKDRDTLGFDFRPLVWAK